MFCFLNGINQKQLTHLDISEAIYRFLRALAFCLQIYYQDDTWHKVHGRSLASCKNKLHSALKEFFNDKPGKLNEPRRTKIGIETFNSLLEACIYLLHNSSYVNDNDFHGLLPLIYALKNAHNHIKIRNNKMSVEFEDALEDMVKPLRAEATESIQAINIEQYREESLFFFDRDFDAYERILDLRSIELHVRRTGSVKPYIHILCWL